ncbi:MAG: DUF4124 domain-containing protein [Pseudomonadota bacterium]
MSRNLSKFACSAVAAVLLSSSAVQGQIYKITDEKEGVVFTDRPDSIGDGDTQKVEEVELQDLNTASPIASPTLPARKSESPAPKPVPLTVEISSPANEATIAMGPGNFSVSASVTPPLASNERLLLTMDGQPVGNPQTGQSWFIEGALRGPHDLVVERTSSSGKSVASSDPVRVYVLRPSILRR